MIVKFHYEGDPVYINAGSIIGIVSDINKKHSGRAPVVKLFEVKKVPRGVVFCEEPLGAITIDEDVEYAAIAWALALEDIEDGVDYGEEEEEANDE